MTSSLLPFDPAAATARLTIDLGAIEANWHTMRALSGAATCGAAVKGNAYGTGMARVAPRLHAAGCRDFFVADTNEGAALRRLLPDAAIHVLSGAFDGSMANLLDHKLIPILNSPGQVSEWLASCTDRPYALHVDTGMNRLGLSLDEAKIFASGGSPAPTLLMSHFACADDSAHPLNALQIERFAQIRRLFPESRASLANSAGIHLGDPAHFDLTRPGIALYGGEAVNGQPNPMQPVARAETRILIVRDAKAGETVSYGAAARLARDSRIAVCGIGYADGFHRAGSSAGVPLRDARPDGAAGAIAGHRVPLVGRVTMDLVMFDVTDVPEDAARPGDWVELFGSKITLDDAARAAGTVGYEFLTSLGNRYARTYKDGT